EKPIPRNLVASDDMEAQKIIQAAAVDSHNSHIAPLHDAFERYALVGRALPIISSDPAIGMERKPDLDIEVLGSPAAFFLLALLFRDGIIRDETVYGDRSPEIRQDHRPVGRILPLPAGLHGLRELVQDRQHPSVR